jgi:TIR domain
MADIVISYKKADRERLALLISSLEARGFTVWWDYEIETGHDWFETILRQIDSATSVIGVWSRNSVTPDGRFAPNEQGLQYVAVEHRRAVSKLAPVLLDIDRVPTEFSQFQACDLSQWNGEREHPEWLKLVSRVEELASPRWIAFRLQTLKAELQNEVRLRKIAQQHLGDALHRLEQESQKNTTTDARIQWLTARLEEARTELERMKTEPLQGLKNGAVSRVFSNFPVAPGWRLWPGLLTKSVIAAFINALVGRAWFLNSGEITIRDHDRYGFVWVLLLTLYCGVGPAVVFAVGGFTERGMSGSVAPLLATIVTLFLVGAVLGSIAFVFNVEFFVSRMTFLLTASGLAAILTFMREGFRPSWFDWKP